MDRSRSLRARPRPQPTLRRERPSDRGPLHLDGAAQLRPAGPWFPAGARAVARSHRQFAVSRTATRRSVASHGITPEPTWYQDAVIYELHVRAFFDSDADGIGDFAGLTQRLNYLQ